MKINVKGEWKPGKIHVYGTRHTVRVETKDGLANAVFELNRSTWRFLGIERIGDKVDIDMPPQMHHLPRECISPAVAKKIYNVDAQRRSYFD